MNKKAIVIIIILLIGAIFRLSSSSNGNFIFNMDNARDMVDVREMVILKKLRLTGPNSAVEGLFNGPAWYYLLAIPFILSGGDPYASIILEIILWAIGGFFLLKLASRFGKLSLLACGSLWIASNYIVLLNLYAFNPNSVTLLTPLLIFLIDKYVNSKKFIYALSSFFLGGLFFNFEMNAGGFIPLVIFFAVLLSRSELLKRKDFWLAILGFIVTLIPQILFDIKHDFIMSSSVIRFLTESRGIGVNMGQRISTIYQSFYGTLSAILMNQKLLTNITVVLFLIYFVNFLRKKNSSQDPLAIICLMFILVPFVGYILLPVQVNAWHLGAPMVAAILLLNIILSCFKFNFLSSASSFIISALIIFFAFSNLVKFYTYDRFIKSQDPSEFVNEIAAIDYVYKYAGNKNFKVYTYLPSVIDYPYQYLIWWYGLKKFGYLPIDYAYAPNKPPYISNKQHFSASIDSLKKRENSNLVFLIEEPNHNYTRFGWEGDFVKMEKLDLQMVGPIRIDIRKEIKK